MKLVVARYNENLAWLDALEFPAIVYNKGENIQTYRKDIEIVKLPNVGREQYTFYYHIYHNYDNLDDYNVFLQGDPFPHVWGEVLEGLSPNDFEAIGWMKVDALDHAKRFDLKVPIEKAVAFLELPSFDWNYQFTAGGQFMASKEVLQKYPKSFYKNILDMWNSDWGKIRHSVPIDAQDYIFEHLNYVLYP